jgi:ABC-type sugar transport system permease subunit
MLQRPTRAGRPSLNVGAERRTLRAALNIKVDRKLREYLTGYLMVLPAGILIFLFGLFPVGFALFVSLYKWRLKRGDFIGLSNYVQASGDLIYLVLLGLALGVAIGAGLMLRRMAGLAREHGRAVWIFSLPGLLLCGSAFSLLRWADLALPLVLDIADKIIGQERSRQIFLRLLGEALATPVVVTAGWQMLLLLAAGVLVLIAASRLTGIGGSAGLAARFGALWSGAAVAVFLAWVTLDAIRSAANMPQNGPAAEAALHVVLIGIGALLLALAWFSWRAGTRAGSTRGFAIKLAVAILLLIAGWVFIAELPPVIAQGDPDMWEGLKVTVMYSLGTVPFQLAFGMFLAILLFQKLRGSELFRMLYFLPYVTPVVASAAVFRQLFSNRLQSPVNQIMKLTGIPPQQWLREPAGLFEMLGKGIGIEVPPWAVGPSLALVVIMIFTIWTYAGYDAVIYLAGLGNIDREQIEAAEIDGATSWQVFRHIIFPLLSPTTYFLSLIAVIGTFKAFTQIWVMTVASGGGSTALGTTDTLSVVIFREFYGNLRYGYASALAFVLFAVILALTLLNNRIQGSRVFYG